MKYILLILLLSLKSYALDIDSKWISKKETCDIKNPAKVIYIFKQWHLDPTENTMLIKKNFPQAENQINIYNQIKTWVEDKKLKTVLAEGCEGEIKENFSKKFNGWTYSDLLTKKDDPNFEKILTHIPMKLEVKYGDVLQTVCVDDEKVIKEQLLEMSDIRGDMGFLERIEQFKDEPEHQKVYVQSAIDVLKLPKTSHTKGVIDFLKKDIDTKIKNTQNGISKRNKAIVEKIKKMDIKEAALVIGGIHAPELKKLLEKEGIGCEVLEPKGYREDIE